MKINKMIFKIIALALIQVFLVMDCVCLADNSFRNFRQPYSNFLSPVINISNNQLKQIYFRLCNAPVDGLFLENQNELTKTTEVLRKTRKILSEIQIDISVEEKRWVDNFKYSKNMRREEFINLVNTALLNREFLTQTLAKMSCYEGVDLDVSRGDSLRINAVTLDAAEYYTVYLVDVFVEDRDIAYKFILAMGQNEISPGQTDNYMYQEVRNLKSLRKINKSMVVKVLAQDKAKISLNGKECEVPFFSPSSAIRMKKQVFLTCPSF